MQQNLLAEPPPPSLQGGSPKSFYRPDIDGLRALAVLPVIFFHAGFSCPGGYIGVDVFFVISGYLITQIIERELNAQRFSILVFYQRRIRRIFPALFVMCAAAILAAWFILLPAELQGFGESLAAAAAFSSNILFYSWTGYFAPDSESMAMLHTWTLSVEEQFYFCWPLCLWFLSRSPVSKWKVPLTVAALVGCLLLSAHWVDGRPNAAFYLLPSRAWELALGALLSFSPVSRKMARLPSMAASVASIAGIAMLAIAVAVYGKTTPFPGFAATLPCMGAALVIAAGEGRPSVGGRILSLRPLVWIGMISYSLYLWHWPILVFGDLITNRKLEKVGRGGLVLLVFVVAWLSWRFVESPFRNLQVPRPKSRYWLIGGLVTSALFFALGAGLSLRKGFPSRGPDVSGLAKEEKAFQESPCLAKTAMLPKTESCLLGANASASRHEVALWGDSHAAQLAPAFAELGKHLGLTTRQITKAGCAPIPGVRFLPADEMRADCPAFNEAALKAVLADGEVRVVVLAAWWDAFASGNLLLTLDGHRPSLTESRQLFASSLRKLLTQLVASGRQVILVGQVPIPPPQLVACVTRARFRGLDENGCVTDESKARARTEQVVNETIRDALTPPQAGVRVVHPYDQLCDNRGCMVESAGVLLYMDGSHLSSMGARLLGSRLEKEIAAALSVGRAIDSP